MHDSVLGDLNIGAYILYYDAYSSRLCIRNAYGRIGSFHNAQKAYSVLASAIFII